MWRGVRSATMTTMTTMENVELAEYLDALEREDCYRVDVVVKESPYEVTQRVSFIGENGAARGPYIRKLIKREAGMGGAYERLFAAQQAGRRFKCLPTIIECYQRDDALVVVMEFVRGETLQDLVYRLDPSVGLARNVFPQLCDAVSELHESFDPPIIHRDLKPSNIIMSQGGCTIIDFGIAREFKDGAQADTARFGTRAFAPPEQFGFGQTTVRSDVYALGMLLYFCLTEEIPETASQADWCVDQRIPENLRGVIAKATAFDPQQRYESAAALQAAFHDAVNAAAPDLGMSQQVVPAQPAPSQPVMQAGPAQGGAPHVVGRVWNIIVIVALIGLSAFFAYWTVHVVVFDPASLDVPAWRAILRTVVGILFLALFAFACLDKRRIRQRFPVIANVRAWQLWTVALIAYIIIVLFNQMA